MTRHQSLIALAQAASVLALSIVSVPAAAATYTVNSGATDTTAKTVGGTDIVTVQSGGTLTSTSNPTINWSSASTGLTITNAGTISSTASGGRAINASGSANPRTITLTNQAGGLITSEDDAFRINLDVTSGTVIVNNYGTIKTTNGGQAIDFDAINSSTATVQINNYAGGVIQSYGQDAIRSGQGAVITNAGLIYADGALGNSYDGIDMQAHTATVINQATGVISGLRHGITSNTGLTVTNYGSITGRNGSGVGSDGNGTVTNYGTITGTWNGVSANGDGDGVDIDYIGTVTNYGTIQGTGAAGVDSGGQPNSSEGIAMGGGTITNNAGATISGLGTGILIDNGSSGAGYGATTITNAGTIKGTTLSAITLVGAYNDSITNSGTITGGNGVAISMGDGNDQLTLLPGSVINGLVDGGAGTDNVTLAGSGVGTFNGALNFETLAVNSGRWTLGFTSSFSGGTTIANGATLLVDGTLNSAVTTASGGILGGTGTVASATIQSGGTVAPGDAGTGTLTVAGAFTQATGSTYVADVGTGNDKISVTGAATIQTGTTLRLIRDAGSYAVGTRYTLLTAAGGLTGTYSVVQQSGALGTELRLGTSGNTIYVDVARTAASLAPLAYTSNQGAVASSLAALGTGNAAYAALTMQPGADGVRAGFDQLSGEVHAALRTAMAHDALLAEGATTNRLDTTQTTSSGLWGQFVGAEGDDDGYDGTADLHHRTGGAIGGYDRDFGGSRIGLAGGYTRTHASLSGQSDRTRLGGWHLLAYGGGDFGRLRLRAGVGYAWINTDTTRGMTFGSFVDSDHAHYRGNVLHSFGDLGFTVPVGGGTVEPFVGGTVLRVHTDGFTESGGAAALSGAARSTSTEFSDVGLRIATPVVGAVSAHASAAWQHAFDAVRPEATLRFAVGASPFTVDGAALSREAAKGTLDIAWQAAPSTSLSVGYAGVIGSEGMENAGRVALSVNF